MSYKQCPICKAWDFSTSHKCKPIFFFTHEDWGDERQEIRASDFDDAAIAFARKFNEDGDYQLMEESTTVIISDGKTEKTFEVSAEPDIYYSSKEINAAQCRKL